jgi:hypothetical protein
MEKIFDNFLQNIFKKSTDELSKHLSKKLNKKEREVYEAINTFDWKVKNTNSDSKELEKKNVESNEKKELNIKKKTIVIQSKNSESSKNSKSSEILKEGTEGVDEEFKKIKTRIEESKSLGKYYCLSANRSISDNSTMRDMYIFNKNKNIAYEENCKIYEKFKKFFEDDESKDKDVNLKTKGLRKSNKGNLVDKNNYVFDISDNKFYGKEVNDKIIPLTDKDKKILGKGNFKESLKEVDEVEDVESLKEIDEVEDETLDLD